MVLTVAHAFARLLLQQPGGQQFNATRSLVFMCPTAEEVWACVLID